MKGETIQSMVLITLALVFYSSEVIGEMGKWVIG